MTTLEGSIEGWWYLPSPEKDFSKAVKIYCELAAKRYAEALRAIIVLNGQNGDFYLAQFGTENFGAVMLGSMRDGMAIWEEAYLSSKDNEKAIPDDPMMYLKKIDPHFKSPGVRGVDWEIPNNVTVFYYYPEDLVFPTGWKDIPQRILQSTQKHQME